MNVFGFLMYPNIYNLIDLCLNRYNQETIRIIVNEDKPEDNEYQI